MKQQLQQLVHSALTEMSVKGTIHCEIPETITIERAKDRSHGDYASNIALVLAKGAGCRPRDLAEKIVSALPASDLLAGVEIAGPGFINFFIQTGTSQAVVARVLNEAAEYGRSTIGAGQRVQVEYVSANPTGPLHVGHGRGAAYGATVADLLSAVGFDVEREYYINDDGRQMDILAASVWLRYLELTGETITFPSNGYRGDYIWDIAASIHREEGDNYRCDSAIVFADIPADEPAGGDKEAHIDALVEVAKGSLQEGGYRCFFDRALETILADIRLDLEEFGVTYQSWFSERSLVASGKVDACLERLKASGHIYEEGGALWFRSTDFGDEKDRVVVRDNGVKTYFASDIAYHMDKLERGHHRIIDIWGADHHGYIPRVKAALTAIGDDPDKLDVLLVQFANLYRDGKKLPMSTRSGEFITLRELRNEVGNDAARLFYVMRKCEQHMDFDLDLAKSQSNDNPVYYIQYAHARICSVVRQMEERGMAHLRDSGLQQLTLLTEEHEESLMTLLSRYPEVVEGAALNHEPHQLLHFLQELAKSLHGYYNSHQFLVEDSNLRDARLCLILAVRQVLGNGLTLLGVSAPETM